MICAYCKSRLFETDRKCPSCGSTVFIEDEPSAGARRGAAGSLDAAEVVDAVYAKGAEVLGHLYTRYRTMNPGIYENPPRSARNRWIALLLCLFGGVVGLHRFYAGKFITGLLFVFTGGLFGVGVLVDLVVILFGHFRDRDGLPLHS